MLDLESTDATRTAAGWSNRINRMKWLRVGARALCEL